MRTGFSLLIATTRPGPEHLPLLARIAAAGYDGAEIPVSPGDAPRMAEVARMLADLGLAATASGGVAGPDRNPMSPDLASRAAGVDDLKRLVDAAVALGADVLCGPFHQPLGVFSGTGPTRVEWEALVTAHRAMGDHAGGAIRLAIEPLNRFECYALNTAADAARLVTEVDRPGYGYLYDTFHAHIEERNPCAAIAVSAKAIAHVHISENDRGVPGAGQIDFAATCATLQNAGYDGWLVVEAFGQALPGLAAATQVWRPLFDTEADVIAGGLATIQTAWTKGTT
jgi:D-psicose/D-tagatose/L-ribulose 3-epimerase